MPQMAPMNWLALFIIFAVIFFLFNMINYFIMSPKTSSIMPYIKTFNKKSLNWKW